MVGLTYVVIDFGASKRRSAGRGAREAVRQVNISTISAEVDHFMRARTRYLRTEHIVRQSHQIQDLLPQSRQARHLLQP